MINYLIQEMDVASLNQEYEKAARIRDQIALLRGIQEQQIIMKGRADIDVLGIAMEVERNMKAENMKVEKTQAAAGNFLACIHVLVIRDGRMLGARHYFPSTKGILQGEESPEQELIEAFILQHYLAHKETQDFPKEILVPFPLKQRSTLMKVLTETCGHPLKIAVPNRGVRTQWMTMAESSAKEALKSRLTKTLDISARFEAFQEALGLEDIPQRLECFDVSHTLGEATVASCVVFDSNGPLKTDYRRFNIKTAKPGDDYAALSEAINRRYTRLKSEEGVLPDVLLIDGGKGQLSSVRAVLNELQVTALTVLAIAKGRSRKPGLETLFLSTNGEEPKILSLASDSPALHLIQQIRDEAHRFAITAHRNKRDKKRIHSRLEDIPGIGKSKRLALLKHFGGLQEVLQANIEELAKVPGISGSLAKRIYTALHGE